MKERPLGTRQFPLSHLMPLSGTQSLRRRAAPASLQLALFYVYTYSYLFTYTHFPLLANDLVHKLNCIYEIIPQMNNKKSLRLQYFLYFMRLHGREEGGRHTQLLSLHQWESHSAVGFMTYERSLHDPVIQCPIRGLRGSGAPLSSLTSCLTLLIPPSARVFTILSPFSLLFLQFCSFVASFS